MPKRSQTNEDARHPIAPIEPIAMRVPEACRYVGISRSTLYLLIAWHEVEIVKMGASTLVLTEIVRQLITSRRQPRLGPGGTGQ